MSRKRKLLMNTVSGITKQLVTVICGFILPRFMLLYYGSSVNGLVTSITNFLSFISLLDMGVGAVVQSNLYKPLADKDDAQISRIVKSSARFFRKIGYIFLIYIVVLCVLFPAVINRDYDAIYSISLIIIISVSTLAQYMFGMTYQLLLNADQRAYIQLFMQIGTIVLNTFFAVVLMRLGTSVHVVKLMTAGVYVLRPIGQAIYVEKHYNIDKKIVLTEEPIRQKWNGFAQHLAFTICQNIDVAVLTLFSTLENVSIYSVYYSVTYGIQQIIMTAATGVESLLGNMIAKNERALLLETFNMIEWVVHTSVTVVFTIAGLSIVPFVSVYTRGINDVNYIAPLFGYILTTAYAIQCLRIPYFRMIKAAGHFKETQNGAYISALLNVVITVALVFRFGLIGAATGTLIAMTYHTCYCAWYLKNHILNRRLIYFVKYLIADSVIAVVSYIVCDNIVYETTTYSAWIILAMKVSVIVLAIALLINILLFNKQIRNAISIVKKRLRR